MATPLSDERLTARAIAQFRHWVALSDSTEDGDERRRLDAMLAASVPDLLDEVERLRGMLDRVAASDQAARASDRKRGELLVEAACRITELEEQNARWQVMVDRMAEKAADNLMRAQAAERRVAELVAVLRRHEWGPSRCLECYSVPPDHHIGCAMDAALHGKEATDDNATE